MKTRLFALLPILLILFSCATGTPSMQTEPPVWLDEAPSDSEEGRVYRGQSTGVTLDQAKATAHDQILNAMIQDLVIDEEDLANPNLASELENFRHRVSRFLRNPDFYPQDGLSIVNEGVWEDEDNLVGFALDLLWTEDAFNAEREHLLSSGDRRSEEFLSAVAIAEVAEAQGLFYDAAFHWARAAAVAQSENYNQGVVDSLARIAPALKGLSVEIQSNPDTAIVGFRPELPVAFSVSQSGNPVSNGEFLLRYPRAGRDGSPIIGFARTQSDADGLVSFRPPEVAFEGEQTVSLAFSAEPFVELLQMQDELLAAINDIELPRISVIYQARSGMRETPTGIVVLETDLTGNPLGSDAAARGVFDTLVAENFNTAILALDPEELRGTAEIEFLRDIKADPRFSESFDRVIFGTVTLEDFSQDGDSFVVQVAGILRLADISRQVILFSQEIRKTSRATNGQQAIASAFRQLGREFAAALTERSL